jgi:hypothetical protein
LPFTAAHKNPADDSRVERRYYRSGEKIFDCVDDLFAELYVDGLGAFAPTVWFGLK